VKYTIQFDAHAFRAIETLPLNVQSHLMEAILLLADDPRPPGCKKLSGGGNEYRIRVGDYRVIYQVFDTHLIVVVVDAGHRREVHQG
jgi:mRNA interferase RelE/StbE